MGIRAVISAYPDGSVVFPVKHIQGWIGPRCTNLVAAFHKAYLNHLNYVAKYYLLDTNQIKKGKFNIYEFAYWTVILRRVNIIIF